MPKGQGCFVDDDNGCTDDPAGPGCGGGDDDGVDNDDDDGDDDESDGDDDDDEPVYMTPVDAAGSSGGDWVQLEGAHHSPVRHEYEVCAGREGWW